MDSWTPRTSRPRCLQLRPGPAGRRPGDWKRPEDRGPGARARAAGPGPRCPVPGLSELAGSRQLPAPEGAHINPSHASAAHQALPHQGGLALDVLARVLEPLPLRLLQPHPHRAPRVPPGARRRGVRACGRAHCGQPQERKCTGKFLAGGGGMQCCSEADYWEKGAAGPPPVPPTSPATPTSTGPRSCSRPSSRRR